VWVLET